MRRAVFLLLVTTLPALADPTRDAVKAGVERCDSVRDNRAWLDCFYGAAQPMRGLLGLAPAPQAAVHPQPAPVMPPPPAPPREAAAPQPPPKPGMFGDLFGPGVKLATGLHLREVKFNDDGTFVLTLEDGQVWKQNSPPDRHAHFDGDPSATVIDITEGLLGSDNLRIRGQKLTYKVHRLR